jgi:predicted exporter
MNRLLIWTCTVIGAVVWLLAGNGDRLRSDLSLFLPAGHNLEQRLLLDQLRKGPASRLILLGIEGGDSADRSRISRQLAQKLAADDLFAQVNNGDQPLDPERWRTLFAYRYLLSPQVAAGRFSADGLRTALKERLQELSSPLSALYSRLLPADPTGELTALEQLLRPKQSPATRDGVWTSGDGTRALLVAETRASGFDLDAQQRAVTVIKKAYADAAPDPRYRLLLSGPGVYGVLSRQVIRDESTLLSLLASLLVAVIVFIGYRSLPLVLYSALPVVSGLLAGTCAVILGFGAIHGITLAFGITLLGMTIDYPIHLFSHAIPGEPAAAGLARIWPTLRLSALTSAAAFAVMMSTDFDGLAQLGLFATIGLAAALLVTRWVLPALPSLNGVSANAGFRHTPGKRFTPTLGRGGRILFTGAFAALSVIALLWIWQQRHNLWEDDLAALSPIPSSLIEQDRTLRRQLGAPDVSRLLVLQGASIEELLQQAEALQPKLEELIAQGAISDAELVSRYLPSARTQRIRQATLPDPQTLRANLAQAMQGLPFRRGTFEPFLRDLSAARELPPLTLPMLEGTPLFSRVHSLLLQAGEGWLLMIPLSGVHGSGIHAGEARYLDLREETRSFVAGFRDEALSRLGWGLLALIALLLVALRSPRRTLRVLLPVALALVVDVALLLALGYRLSLFHLVALLLVAGISLDYSLFVNRPRIDPEEFRHTRHALRICLASTAAVFGLLALSQLPVLKAIGMTVVIGVTSGYIAAFAVTGPEKHR